MSFHWRDDGSETQRQNCAGHRCDGRHRPGHCGATRDGGRHHSHLRKRSEKARCGRRASRAGGGTVRSVLADPATSDGALKLAEAEPDVDILVNNLGIYEAKSFSDISDQDWHHIIEVNVVSGARLARHYFPRMLGRNWGRVIFRCQRECAVDPFRDYSLWHDKKRPACRCAGASGTDAWNGGDRQHGPSRTHSVGGHCRVHFLGHQR